MKKSEILKEVEKEIKVGLKEKHVPNEYFKDRKGLFVYSSFEDNILNKAEPTKADAEFKLKSFDLEKRSTDEEIEKDLGDKHIFSETDVCAVIAGLIEKQANGEEGILKNDGYANLFYTSSHVVGVGWNGGGWGVSAWFRGSRWDGGTRVFTPATEI